MIPDINKVTLRGVITNIISNPKTTIVTVSTRDYQRKRDANGRLHTDAPVVTFFDKEGQDVADKFKKLDHVTVEAIIQNTYNHLQLDGRQECWGIKIEKTMSLIENANEGQEAAVHPGRFGHLYPDDINQVVLTGKVTNVAARGAWARISIKTNTDGYRSVSFVSYYVQDAEQYARVLTKGSTISVVGKVTVAERNGVNGNKGKRIRYEEVIARELVVLNRATNTEGKDDNTIDRNTLPDFFSTASN